MTKDDLPSLPPIEEVNFTLPYVYTDIQMTDYALAAIAAHDAKREKVLMRQDRRNGNAEGGAMTDNMPPLHHPDLVGGITWTDMERRAIHAYARAYARQFSKANAELRAEVERLKQRRPER